MRIIFMAFLLALTTLCGCTAEPPASSDKKDNMPEAGEKENATSAMPEIRYYVLSDG